ncbi:30S ribosomal protein S12 methylthiotransferase RimO [Candidatus Peregrinibacteria bacterium]|nr:30S ribosomal protein S12 methylthiotransferase RimO [Candidatus Peregrinibacteria bacterium]
MKNLRNMRLHMVSLGCAKNRVDSEKVLHILQDQGCTITDNPEEADCLLVNSCGFIDAAKRETIDTILELAEIKKTRPGAKLAVMGCMVERYKAEMQNDLPEIDYFLAISDESTKEVYRTDNISRVTQPGVVSAYLKIAEGCGNACSFCSIPAIRGPLKSRPPEAIIAEAKQLLDIGIRELVLVAQDTTRYGADLRRKNGLVELLKELKNLKELQGGWLRVMYLYPTLITDAMIDMIASGPPFTPYIDVPFQHYDDAVLKRMGRQETSKDIQSLMERIRAKMPHGAIRTSFIVGFPGETEKQFNNLLKFVKEAQFDHMGVFTYSHEEGTPAASLVDDVPEEVKEKRQAQLMQAQNAVSKKKNKEKVGKTFDALVERYDTQNSLLIGRLATQAPEVDGELILDDCEAAPGEIIRITVTRAMDYDLIAHKV